ncbi:serine acetyltransferase 1, chloroplastic [Ziziphus jujuba]|uniref:serine O-acetyltransferase n=1 Tax=Ziziphus jujuba TaxID=326968 RepID=A0ABM3I275_ZIZJJ|nr:serine acetyltransferase 1, chloroplastic [Ziziphus jujuba]
MSASFVGSSFIPVPVKTRYTHKAHRTKATCLDSSSRTQIKAGHFPDRLCIDDSVFKYLKYYRPSSTNLLFITTPIPNQQDLFENHTSVKDGAKKDEVWMKMREEARFDVEQEPILSHYYSTSILSHNSLESALASQLSIKLSNSGIPINTLYEIFIDIFKEDEYTVRAVREDLKAVKVRDPTCTSYVQCFLNFKGFLACQAHRVAHKLWLQGRKPLALLIQNRVSEVFAVDIHPGAKIGSGILIDHATGVVVGETAVIGNNVSILHNVTLGGTGKVYGDRHPKIGDGALIGTGTCILGNIKIGDGAKVGAGSVVLKEVPSRSTAVGNPARLIGGKNPVRLDKTPSLTMDQTSHITEWSDYVI